MEKVKNENKTNSSKGTSKSKTTKKETSVKKPTTKSKTKSTTEEVKKPKVKKSKKEETSQIQNIKDTLISILEKSYNIKTRAWREEVKETTLNRIKISTECTNDKYTNEYTILMYVRDLAKKSKYAVYDFGMDEKGYHFELIGPIENLEL